MWTMKLKWIVSWHKPTYSYQIPHQNYWELSGLPQFMLHAQREWHPLREAAAEYGLEGTPARGPLTVFHVDMGVDINTVTCMYNTSVLALRV